MKKQIIYIIFPIILGGCSFTKTEQKSVIPAIEIPEVNHEYFEVEIFTLNWEDIFFENNSPYYIYVYSTSCSHCQELKNWIIEKALDRGDIFFVKSTNKIPLSGDVSSSIGATKVEDISLLGYPSMLKINEKTVVKNVAGSSKIKDLLN